MIMADLPRTRFREALTSWLDKPTRTTTDGKILHDMRDLSFGYRGGTHGQIRCWVYSSAVTTVEMCFAFYSNFTIDDLICKVLPVGASTRSGAGATIQFNGDNCMKDLGTGGIFLCHDGLVTVGTRISRNDLVGLITTSALEALARLGGLPPKGGWPLRLGSTDDFPALVDRVFLYAYCIEQAKRFLRGEDALP